MNILSANEVSGNFNHLSEVMHMNYAKSFEAAGNCDFKFKTC